MNKAFEKILERLKNIGWVYADYYPDGTNMSRISKKSVSYDEVIKIVQEVAEEYNNGWIPCSERLPDEHKLYDITFKNDAGIHSDADETELVENEVLAWAEKREPYQPKGE